MDIQDLSASLRNIQHSGVCFNPEERVQLEMGMQQLLNNSAETEFEELLFWGKLVGLNGDYYVALGLVFTGRYEFAEKRFFYATSSDFTFKPFPTLNDQHRMNTTRLRPCSLETLSSFTRRLSLKRVLSPVREKSRSLRRL